MCISHKSPVFAPHHRDEDWEALVNLLLLPFFFFIYLLIFVFSKFIYLLFLAVLGLHCCTRAFSSCGQQGLLFVVLRGLLIAVASPVVEHGL